jgi:hypothetical protein
MVHGLFADNAFQNKIPAQLQSRLLNSAGGDVLGRNPGFHVTSTSAIEPSVIDLATVRILKFPVGGAADRYGIDVAVKYERAPAAATRDYADDVRPPSFFLPEIDFAAKPPIFLSQSFIARRLTPKHLGSVYAGIVGIDARNLN